jgi:hypothetical protein
VSRGAANLWTAIIVLWGATGSVALFRLGLERVERPPPAEVWCEPPAIEDEPEPEPRLAWGERLVNSYFRDVSVYTPSCDGGSLDRKTSGNTLRGRERRYPVEQTTIRSIYDLELATIAIPWHERKRLHEELIEHPDGSMNHRWRLRVVGLDQKGVRRLPCDRVPRRDRDGNLLPQRRRFDAFMHVDQGLARRIGVNLMLVEEWEVGWFPEEGSE